MDNFGPVDKYRYVRTTIAESERYQASFVPETEDGPRQGGEEARAVGFSPGGSG